YGLDVLRYKVNRWEHEFCKTNFDGWILSSSSSISEDLIKAMRHRISVINSMNIDGLASDEEYTHELINLTGNAIRWIDGN
ncbi:12129_t:CDS:2, partial [Racocetra persica]